MWPEEVVHSLGTRVFICVCMCACVCLYLSQRGVIYWSSVHSCILCHIKPHFIACCWVEHLLGLLIWGGELSRHWSMITELQWLLRCSPLSPTASVLFFACLSPYLPFLHPRLLSLSSCLWLPPVKGHYTCFCFTMTFSVDWPFTVNCFSPCVLCNFCY